MGGERRRCACVCVWGGGGEEVGRVFVWVQGCSAHAVAFDIQMTTEGRCAPFMGGGVWVCGVGVWRARGARTVHALMRVHSPSSWLGRSKFPGGQPTAQDRLAPRSAAGYATTASAGAVAQGCGRALHTKGRGGEGEAQVGVARSRGEHTCPPEPERLVLEGTLGQPGPDLRCGETRKATHTHAHTHGHAHRCT